MKKILLTLFLSILALNVAEAKKLIDGKVNEISVSEFVSLVSEYSGGFEKWDFKGKRPAVIGFYATWDPWYRQLLLPIMESLAVKYKGRVDFYKFDIHSEVKLMRAYNISSTPVVLFAPIEGDPEYIVGLYSEKDYVEVIQFMFQIK